MDELKERAAQERREYQRKWRAANKDKVREINRRYWLKKAAKAIKKEGGGNDAADKANREIQPAATASD